jgi:exodeoxyribonuclease-3
MKLISWNVNGIRSVLSKGLREYVHRESPDILCLQETRAEPAVVGELWKEHYEAHWNLAEKKGYSGTALFTRVSPIRVTRGIGTPAHDT